MQDQPAAMDDKALLLRVSEGDETAFRNLFKTYYNQLGGFIMRITGSEQLTQEIVQDVFLKIWIKRSSLAEIDHFKAYLFVVARNHTFNCLKQIAREKCRNEIWADTVLRQASNNVDETFLTDAGKLIDEATELLPPRQRKVYILSRREGMKHAEIARELNISLETVKKHMVLALGFLKSYLRTHIGFFILLTVNFFIKQINLFIPLPPF
ncbi:MAG: RNA polymerase sigma-70 factor [Ginsengibacter sp.]